jgi:hypothetical protein
MGDPSAQTGRARNLLWRHFTRDRGGSGGARSAVRVVRSPDETADFEVSAIGDVRTAAARYPKDEGLRSLIADLRKVSPRFEELWESGVVGTHSADLKVIEHPEVGRLTLDRDVLTVQGADLRVIVYSAEPGSEAAEKLAMVRVIGLQRLGIDAELGHGNEDAVASGSGPVIEGAR